MAYGQRHYVSTAGPDESKIEYAGGSLDRVERAAKPDGRSLTERANSAAGRARTIVSGLSEIYARVQDGVDRNPPAPPADKAPLSHVTFALTEIDGAHESALELIQEILARL